VLLCEKGADINIPDHRKRSPLHYAAMIGSIEFLRTFIKRDVDMDAQDENGMSPLDIVYDREFYEMLIVMTNNGADISKFYDEEWNIKLRTQNRFDNEEDTETDTTSVDPYGFYPHQKRRRNNAQRSIKNVHIKKWKQNIVLTPEEIPKKRKIRIIKRIYKDRLPDSLRSEFWLFCLQLDETTATTEFKQLLTKKLPTIDAIQIDKDINRTIRGHETYHTRYGEGQCKLFRVLSAYAMYNEATRYTQGMSTLAAILVMYTPSEEVAFAGLKQLFIKYNFNEFYGNGLAGLQKYVFPIFQSLVQIHIPRMHQHLVKYLNDDYCGLFIPNWFLEVFFDSLSWPLMLKVWDTLLWVGHSALYSVSLALLSILQDQILEKSDMSQIIKIIKGTYDMYIEDKKTFKDGL